MKRESKVWVCCNFETNYFRELLLDDFLTKWPIGYCVHIIFMSSDVPAYVPEQQSYLLSNWFLERLTHQSQLFWFGLAFESSSNCFSCCRKWKKGQIRPDTDTKKVFVTVYLVQVSTGSTIIRRKDGTCISKDQNYHNVPPTSTLVNIISNVIER